MRAGARAIVLTRVSQSLSLSRSSGLLLSRRHMTRTLAIRVLSCALLFSAIPLAAGRGLSGLPQKTKAGTGSAPAKPKIDVCALLTSAEIEAVQGEPAKETKPGVQPSGGILTSQCLFLTATPHTTLPLLSPPTAPAL